jgi:hypothetical protein
MKAPVHYMFKDTAGFGGFFSPRMILFWIGISLAVLRYRSHPRVSAFLLTAILTPFLLSNLVFVDFEPARLLGLFFYHQNKRFSELGLLPIVLGWAILIYTTSELKNARKLMQVAIGLLLLSVDLWAVPRLALSQQRYFKKYGTPTLNRFQKMHESFVYWDLPDAKWFCNHLETQALLVADWQNLQDRFYITGTDCDSDVLTNPHCLGRQQVIQEKLQSSAIKKVALLEDNPVPITCAVEF